MAMKQWAAFQTYIANELCQQAEKAKSFAVLIALGWHSQCITNEDVPTTIALVVNGTPQASDGQ